MKNGPVLKYSPNDFLVRENMVVSLTTQAAAKQHYLLLRKCGYTTMEAIRRIAAEFELESTAITYGGLKDEDGITEQLLAVPLGIFQHHSSCGEWKSIETAHRWLELQHYGYGQEPLHIGNLQGNGFQLVVRNLDHHAAARYQNKKKINLFFLNYYDTQRFGVAAGPKCTHQVGAAILHEQWKKALNCLANLRAPESEMARSWTRAAHDFFLQMDPRVAAFYLAAYVSFQWNNQLRERVAEICPGRYCDLELEGLRYRYVSSADAMMLLSKIAELPYVRYSYMNHEKVQTRLRRATVVQTAVTVHPPVTDEQIANTFKLGLSFFLPSGCYATAAVRQLLAFH